MGGEIARWPTTTAANQGRRGLQRIYGRMRTHSRYEHSEIQGVVFDAALTLVCTHRRDVIRQAMRGTIVTIANASVEINKRPLPRSSAASVISSFRGQHALDARLPACPMTLGTWSSGA
jgi:hypothetical protein